MGFVSLFKRCCCCCWRHRSPSRRVSDTVLASELALAEWLFAPRSDTRCGELFSWLVAASLQGHPLAIATLNLREGLLLAADEPRASFAQNGKSIVRDLDRIQEQVLGQPIGLDPRVDPHDVRGAWLRWVDDVIGVTTPSGVSLPTTTARRFADCMARLEAQSPGARMYALGSLLHACVHDFDNGEPVVVRSLDKPISLEVLQSQCPWLPADAFDVPSEPCAPDQQVTCPVCDRLGGSRPTYKHCRYIQYNGHNGGKAGDPVGSIGDCIELDPAGKRHDKSDLYFWRVSRAEGPANSLTSDDYLMGATWDNEAGRQALGTRTPDEIKPLLNRPDIQSQSVVFMWVYTRQHWCPDHHLLFRHLRLAFPTVSDIALTMLLLLHPQTAGAESDAAVFSIAAGVLSKL